MRVAVLLLSLCVTGFAGEPPRLPQPDLKLARLLPSGELEVQSVSYVTEQRNRIVRVQVIVDGQPQAVEKLEEYSDLRMILRPETHSVDEFKLGDQTGGPLSRTAREALEKDFTPILVVYEGVVVLDPFWQQFYRPELPMVQLTGPPVP